MNILLTNDDGIYAPGIYAAYRELVKIGNVTVVAPDSEKSSVGHGITLAHPVRQKKVQRKKKFFGYGVSGTPADCVKFAVDVILKEKPDFVVSGINQGPNEGCSVHYSGTVAGAREGALMGIPSIAASLDSFEKAEFDYAAKCIVKLLKFAAKHPLPAGTFLNLNVPCVARDKVKEMRFTRQCLEPIHGIFKKCKDPNLKEYFWLTGKMAYRSRDNDIDTYALNNKYVTVTPIRCDSTDHDFYDRVQSIKL